MTKEEVMAEILRVFLTGGKLYHFVSERDGSSRTFYLTSSEFVDDTKAIFKHRGGLKAMNIEARVSLTQAAEIINEYWDRRVE